MFRFVRQFADARFHVFRAKTFEVLAGLANQQFRQRGTGRDRRGTSARLKRRPRHHTPFECRGEPQDVAADRIAHLHHHRGGRQFAHMARVLKVVD
jgi:hypothetical protein